MTFKLRIFIARTLMSVVAAVILTPADAQELCGHRLNEPIAALFDQLIKSEGASIVSRDTSFVVVRDKASNNWSFTVAGHPAHPSVACRQIQESGGRVFVRTEIECQAREPACKNLAADYQALDARMQEAIQRDLQKKK